ncbi:MAG: hypothetical protein AAGF24_09765 [Cyanobacteria bacterium P01_H01_bin.121]
MAQARPIGPINLEGIIRQVTWHPARFIPAVPLMSGSLGRDRTIQAHYKLRLDVIEVSDPEEYARLMGGVMVNHPQDDGFLAVGKRIRILGLRQAGDEGGMQTFLDRLEVL